MKQARGWTQGEHSQIIVVKAGFLEKFYNNDFVGLSKCTRGEVLTDEQSLLKELCRDTRINRREVGIVSTVIMTRAWALRSTANDSTS